MTDSLLSVLEQIGREQRRNGGNPIQESFEPEEADLIEQLRAAGLVRVGGTTEMMDAVLFHDLELTPQGAAELANLLKSNT